MYPFFIKIRPYLSLFPIGTIVISFELLSSFFDLVGGFFLFLYERVGFFNICLFVKETIFGIPNDYI